MSDEDHKVEEVGRRIEYLVDLLHVTTQDLLLVLEDYKEDDPNDRS